MAINPFKVRNGLIVGEAATSNVIAEFKSTDAIFVPEGTTGERPSPGANGYFRYNTTLNEFEGYIAGAWSPIGGGANVSASGTAPTTPKLGDLWFHTTEEILYAYVNNGVESVWLDVTTDPFGPEFTASGTAPTSPGYNDLWFDTTDDILSVYINDGNQDVWIDILTAGSIADGYVAVSEQTFTNSETGIARNNIDAAHISAMATQNFLINGFGQWAEMEGDLAYSNTNNRYMNDLWVAVFSGGHDANSWGTTSVRPNSSVQRTNVMSVKVANAAPNSAHYMLFSQRIEGERIARLAWGTTDALPITVGFWAYSTQPTTFCSSMRDSTVTRSHLKSHTIAGNTWTYYTYTIPGPTDGTFYTNTSIGAYFHVAIAAGADFQNTTAGSWINDNALATASISNFGGFGAGNTFYFGGSFILPGEHTISAADSLYLQDNDLDELTKIKRYFQKFSATGQGPFGGSGTTVERIGVHLDTQMRAAPDLNITGTMNFWDGSGTTYTRNTTVSTFTANNKLDFTANLTTTGTVGRCGSVYNSTIELRSLL